MVSESAQSDFVEQYIPINVFNSLSSSIIPAVVRFCLASNGSRKGSECELVIQDPPRAFLRGERQEIDAFLLSAEAGSAWTLIYPKFAVAVPRIDVLALPVGYATA